MDSLNMGNGLVGAFQTGGFWMIPIAIAFAVSVAFTIERFVRRLKGGVFVDDLLQLANPRQVLAGDISLFRDFTLQR